MKTLLLALMIALPTCFAQAGRVASEGSGERGLNEPVMIQYLKSNWGYTYQLQGFYVGTATVTMVPVSREAALALRSLDKKSKYNCILQNSTYVPNDERMGGGTYFVLDINCN